MNLLAYGIDHCAEAYSSRAWRDGRRTRRGFHRELFSLYMWVESWGDLLEQDSDELGCSAGSWTWGEIVQGSYGHGYSMSWARPDD